MMKKKKRMKGIDRLVPLGFGWRSSNVSVRFGEETPSLSLSFKETNAFGVCAAIQVQF